MPDLSAVFRRLIAPLEARIRGMVSRGTISKVDDTKQTQELQVRLLAGEIRSIVERLQQYGFTSNPPLGSETVMVFPGGSREHGLALAAEDRAQRKKGLAVGDVALYAIGGTTSLLLEPATEKVTIEGDEIVCNGFVKITLAVGASSIVIDSTSITLKAGTINLDS